MRRSNENVLRIFQNDDLQSLEILTGCHFINSMSKNIDRFIFFEKKYNLYDQIRHKIC